MIQRIVKQNTAEFLALPDKPAERIGALRSGAGVWSGHIVPQIIHIGERIIQQGIQHLRNIAEMCVEGSPADFRLAANIRNRDCIVFFEPLDPQKGISDGLFCVNSPAVSFPCVRHTKSPDDMCQEHFATLFAALLFPFPAVPDQNSPAMRIEYGRRRRSPGWCVYPNEEAASLPLRPDIQQ